MEISRLKIPDHVLLKAQDINASSDDILLTIKEGNKVKYSDTGWTTYYGEKLQVVVKSNTVIRVHRNARNETFNALRYSSSELETLHYQAEIQNNDRAMCELGDLYAKGLQVKQDYKRALELYQRACSKGNSHAMCKLSDLYSNVSAGFYNKDLADEWFQKAADHGNSYALSHTAQKLLASYISSKPSKELADKIVSYLEKACEKNSSRALFTLADIYHHGYLGETNIEKAIEFYTKAGQSGSPGSLKYLTNFCKESKYSADKLEDTLNTMTSYLSKSSRGMLLELGEMMIEDEVGFCKSRGMNLIEAAALQVKQFPEAMLALAKYYRKGIACEPNLRLCRYWYNKLFELQLILSKSDNAESLWTLGKYYMIGYVGDIDFEKAEYYFKKAVEVSNEEMYIRSLASLYFYGRLGDRDPASGEDKLKELLLSKQEKALLNDSSECLRLGSFFLHTNYQFSTYEKAKFWLSKALSLGNKAAEPLLAELYLNNKSGYTNIALGLELIEKNILSGNIDALSGFSVASSYLNCGNQTFVIWLKRISSIKVNDDSGTNGKNRRELKEFVDIYLANVYKKGLLYDIGRKKAYYHYNKLYVEFKTPVAKKNLVEAYFSHTLPEEYKETIEEFFLKLPSLIDKAENFEKFISYISMLSKLLRIGTLFPLNLLESAKWYCIVEFYSSDIKSIKTNNILSSLPKECSSVADKLYDTEYVANELVALTEKCKINKLPVFNKILYRILGDIFYGGFLVKRNLNKAIKMYSEASSLNNSRASITIARIFMEEGKKYTSMRFYELSVKQGNNEAVSELSTLIQENDTFKSHLPFLDNYIHKSSVAEDVIFKTPPYKYLKTYPSNCEEMHALAVGYLSESNSSKKNLNEAAYWLRKSGKNGNLESFVKLHNLYKTGELGGNVTTVFVRYEFKIARVLLKALKKLKCNLLDLKIEDATIIKDICQVSEVLKGIDGNTFQEIISRLDKIGPTEEFSSNCLDEVILLLERYFFEYEQHKRIRSNYGQDFNNKLDENKQI